MDVIKAAAAPENMLVLPRENHDALHRGSTAREQAVFRLGQMDMRESIADMLRDTAMQLSSTVIRSAILHASRMVREMEIPDGGVPIENS